MQKFTTTELRWVIRELENTAEECMQMATKVEGNIRAFFKLRAEKSSSLAKKFRLAIDNEDKRIAIV